MASTNITTYRGMIRSLSNTLPLPPPPVVVLLPFLTIPALSLTNERGGCEVVVIYILHKTFEFPIFTTLPLLLMSS
jgi:hypothetical protein